MEEYKAHVFFKDIVFKRTTTKSFHDMSCKTKKILIHRLQENSQKPAYLHPASDQLWRHEQQYTTGAVNFAVQRVIDMEQRKRGLLSFFCSPSPVFQPRIHFHLLVLDLACIPEDKDGKKKIVCPLAYQTVVMARKAITYLHVRQIGRQETPTLKRNAFPLITGSDLIKTLFDSYKQSLVYGQFGSGRDPTANCILRNSYDREQHLRMLVDTWQSLDNTALLLALREHFAIAARHAMLLRDEDLRNLNQSDCFFKELTHVQHVGTQKILALVFCLHKGKTNQSGDAQYSVAVRHADVRRCAIGAMAFYFFERWTVRYISFFFLYSDHATRQGLRYSLFAGFCHSRFLETIPTYPALRQCSTRPGWSIKCCMELARSPMNQFPTLLLETRHTKC